MAESADTAERAPADRVRDLLSTGYIDLKRARAVELAVPEVREGILDWLAAFAAAGAWRDFEAFANLALHLCPDALGGVLAPVIASGTPRVNLDDLVDLLAEIGPAAADAVPALCTLLDGRAPVDGPYYGLCVRIVHALAAIGGPVAREALRALCEGERPALLRREAAAALAGTAAANGGTAVRGAAPEGAVACEGAVAREGAAVREGAAACEGAARGGSAAVREGAAGHDGAAVREGAVGGGGVAGRDGDGGGAGAQGGGAGRRAPAACRGHAS